VSDQPLITAILAGERDPETLADLRDKRCRSRREDILEAPPASGWQSLLAVPLWLSPPAAVTPPPPPHLRCPHCGQFTLAVMGYVQCHPP